MRPLLPPRCRPPPRNLWTNQRPVRPTSITAGPQSPPARCLSLYALVAAQGLRVSLPERPARGPHAHPHAGAVSISRTDQQRESSDPPLPGPPRPSAAAAAETGAASAANETPTRGRCFPAEAGPCRSPRPCRPLPARFRHLAPRYEETWFAYFAENTVAVDPSSVRSCTKLSASQWNCHYSMSLHRTPRPTGPRGQRSPRT